MKFITNSPRTEIEVGDIVRVTRIAKSHKDGWDDSWISPEMDRQVGKVSEVLKIKESAVNGICKEMLLKNNSGYLLYYPEFVLELV